jgi:hypothetical protein
MNDVERFVSDLQQLFVGISDKDQLKASAHRTLAAFIGRLVVRDDAYAPLEEINQSLREARQRLVGMSFEGDARNLRIEVLTELDKAITTTTPRR